MCVCIRSLLEGARRVSSLSYIHTYVHPYIHTCTRTFIRTYIQVGVLSLLDEECAMPGGADSTYVGKLHKRFEDNGAYAIPSRKGGGRGKVSLG